VKRIGVTLLALGAIAQLHHSHRVYPAESRNGVRLLLTAQSQTALQPCGCQAAQLGGLARTAAHVRKLAGDADAVLLEVAPRWPTGEQAEVIAKALELLKCDAVLCLDPGQASASRAGRWLKPKDSAVATIPGHGTPIRFHGLVEVAQPRTDAKGEGPELHCRLERTPGSDRGATLLLWPAVAATAANVALAAKVKDSTPSAGAATSAGELRIPLDLDGKQVTVIDLERDGDAWKATWRHVAVDGSAGEQPEVKALVDQFYRQRAHLLATAAEQTEGFWETKGYADAAQCVKCHGSEHRSWQGQRHARAVETLRAKERLVPDCLRCHSTLFRQTGAFRLDAPGALASVECRECHGDGVVHSLLGRKDQIARTPTEATCRQCHQGEHDPDFDYAGAILRVSHHGDTGNTEK
jgi:hypothetical protein